MALYQIGSPFRVLQPPVHATGEHSPEWNALVQRRQEIESDPLLDADAKADLIAQWRHMANDTRPLLQASPTLAGLPPVLITGTRAWVVCLLVLSLLLLWGVGGFHSDALRWPAKTRDAIQIQSSTVDRSDQAHPGDGVKLEDRLAGLQSRLKTNPDDLQGWVLLARTQASLAQYPEAAASLRQALQRSPSHPDLLADLADMLAMAQGRVLTGEPEQYIAQALKSDPKHEKALALAATAAEQSGHTAQASMYWNLLSQVQQTRLKGEGNTTSPDTPAAGPAVFKVQVAVRLSADAIQRASPKAVLFVVAKWQAGPGMPLAAIRVPASQLKAGINQVTLDENTLIQPDALAQAQPMGSTSAVFVQARLAQQGTPTPADGDLQSNWQQTPMVNSLLQLELEQP
ncbi:hypothetical protein NQT62_07475 [Limnobacter humi]|uniref:Tetratricopeptide repeat protein n=1 Tax=Limnobacter humi TaxID=1778671 RepID=A0ABT1WIN5_9BURK|nr:hypothetical protein [Limnobacter humi]MCQ8896274.1 hypothetical protein [Limnobacter humi]